MLAFLIGLGLFSVPTPPAPEAISRLLNHQELQTLVYQAAQRYGADKDDMFRTVLCEADKTKLNEETRYMTDGQSHYIMKDGTVEKSYGLAMWHPEAGNRGVDGEVITEQSAKDPVYALNSMALYFSQGKERLWTCWAERHAL